jgi:putative transposase
MAVRFCRAARQPSEGSRRVPDSRLLTALNEAERTQAHTRFALLQPYLESGVPLRQLAQVHGVPLRTLQRWLQHYRHHGLAGLVRPPRKDRGRRQIAPDLQRLIEGLALQRPAPSIAYVHRQVAAIATQQDWPVPSYATVYALVRSLDPALVTLAHAGPKVYSETYDLLQRREASRPNELWQADHTPLDIWLLDEHGKPARPWLTSIMDDYSRAIAGYFLSFQAPSAIQTALALRQAIWRKPDAQWQICGIPETFYCDHGSDFTSRHLEQVSADLKMRLVFSLPGVPRGRGKIERFFETVNQLFLCAQPGYSPAGANIPAPTLTLSAFETRFRTFLLEDYHTRHHSEIHMAPQARWAAGGFLPQFPDSLEQLDLLLLTVAKTRRVQQDGIRFAGQRYLDLTLAAYVGEAVTIRYDPRDIAEIRVYHQDTFLCRAVCPELAGETIALKDLIRARNRRRRELRETLSDRAALVDALRPSTPAPPEAPPPDPTTEAAAPPLKRYYHD